MADNFIDNITITDLMILFLGLLIILIYGIKWIWVIFLIIGFVIAKSYFHSMGNCDTCTPPDQTKRETIKNDDDWDDDDNIAIGLYD